MEETGVQVTVNDASETVIVGGEAENVELSKKPKATAKLAVGPEQPAVKAEGGE